MSPRQPELSPLKRALLAVDRMQAELAACRAAEREPIAIVGIGCRFPGDEQGPKGYWNTLHGPSHAVSAVPHARFPGAAFEHGVHAEARALRFGGYLRDVAQFDADLFGLSRREAEVLDPQQRLLLEVGWHALEDAGIAPDSLRGSRTGTFIGLMNNDYLVRLMGSGVDALDVYAATGNGHCFPAGRLAYTFGFTGPAMVVDTACSSSLVALSLAVDSLRRRTSDLALCGGANLMLSPSAMRLTAKTQAMSPDGTCRAFDAGANGFVRGEGAGVLILKRLSDAKRSNDRILACVRSVAVNQDGRSNGLTVPNVRAQEALLRDALRQAGIDAERVGYVEAHGTGTVLGDPIEIDALRSVYGAASSGAPSCVLGAAKSTIGHLEAAAGVAGIIKAVMALRHGTIPANHNFVQVNPRIDLEGTRLRIARAPTAFAAVPGELRCAGVSSFGLSGTNAHAVLEEYAADVNSTNDDIRIDDGPSVLLLSAHSEASLRALARAHADALATLPRAEVGAWIRATALTRASLPERAAVLGHEPEALAEQLHAVARGEGRLSSHSVCTGRRDRKPVVGLLFTGQGSQYAGMGKALYERFPCFRDALDACACDFGDIGGRDLLSVLLDESSASMLDRTRYTQPALFALQYALYQLWTSRGLRPDAVLGHSIGEFAAAVAAGVCSREQASALVLERARRMDALPEGGMMVATDLSLARALELAAEFRGRIAIAAHNAENAVVLSGDADALRGLSERWAAEGVSARELKVSHAFHSPRMAEAAAAFGRFAEGFTFACSRIPLVRNLDAQVCDRPWDAAYLERHMVETVQFHRCMQEMKDRGVDVWFELGPHPVLLGLAGLSSSPSGIATMRRGEPERDVDARALGRAFVQGVGLDARALFGRDASKAPCLPLYPFDRQRYWPRCADVEHPSATIATAAMPGQRVEVPGPQQHFALTLDPDRDAVLWEHRLHGVAVLPGAHALVWVAKAVAQQWPGRDVSLHDVQWLDFVALGEGPVSLSLVLERGPDNAEFSVYRKDANGFSRVASGRFEVIAERDDETIDVLAVSGRCSERQSPDDFYRAMAERGVVLGDPFRLHASVMRGEGEALVGLRPMHDETVVIDAAFHGLAHALGRRDQEELRLPHRVERVWWRADGLATPATWAYARSRDDQSEDDDVAGDITVLDAAGRTQVRIEALHVRAVDARSLPRLAIAPDTSFHRIAWVDPPDAPSLYHGPLIGRWALLGDPGGRAEALAQAIEARGGTVTRLAWDAVDASDSSAGRRIDADLAACRAQGPLRGVIHACSLDPTPGRAAGEATEHTVLSILPLVQALARQADREPPRLWLLTAGATAERPVDEACVERAGVWALGRVIRSEHPELGCVRVDLDADADPAKIADLLESPGREDELRLGRNGWAVARLMPSPLQSTKDVEISGTHVVTGGLGGVGRIVARHLIARGCRHLVLLGRRTPDDADVVTLNTLRELGATVEYRSIDIADREAVVRCVEDLGPKLRGIYHLAGVLRDGTLSNQTAEGFREVYAAKVTGAWNLHRATQSLALDAFVLFSSAAAFFGASGQANYAAANAVLGAMARWRRSQGLPGLCLGWGPIDGGMARRTHEARGGSHLRGLRVMGEHEVSSLLDEAMRSDAVDIGVFDVQARALIELYPHLSRWRYLEPLLETAAAPSQGRPGFAPGWLRAELEASPASAHERLRSFLEDTIAQARGGNVTIDRRSSLSELGVDSLMGVEIKNAIESALGTRVSVAVLFGVADFDGLVSTLLGDSLPGQTAPTHVDVAKTAEPDFAALPDEEFLALMEAELSLGKVGMVR